MLVPPYDDPLVIAGQGTVGREIVEEIARLGLTLDCVVVNASGGGLTAGIALAVKARAPRRQHLHRRARRLRRPHPLVRERQARAQPGAHRHHLRCADGAVAGQAHLRDQPRPGRPRRDRDRGGGRPRGGLRVPRAQARGRARRRGRRSPRCSPATSTSPARPRWSCSRAATSIRSCSRASSRERGARSPSVPVARRRYGIHPSAWVLGAADLLPLPTSPGLGEYPPTLGLAKPPLVGWVELLRNPSHHASHRATPFGENVMGFAKAQPILRACAAGTAPMQLNCRTTGPVGARLLVARELVVFL